MSQRIDQFCEDLRLKLTNIDSGLNGLKIKIDGKGHGVEQDVRNHLDRVQKRIEQGRTKVAASQAEVKNWVDDKKTETKEKIGEWKATRETSKLQTRADRAERYAVAAVNVAVAALDEAERASLEAWLARQDANAAKPK
jgi:predicted  nucleic acid-binding Zn-ribbon protein